MSPVFGLEVDNQVSAYNFTAAVNDRLNVKNMIRNPFSGSARIKVTGFYARVVIMDLNPIYPSVGVFGSVTIGALLAVAYFAGWWLLYIPAGFLILAAFIHSKYFFYLVAWAGLKKAGYKGRPKLLTNGELLKIMLERAL